MALQPRRGPAPWCPFRLITFHHPDYPEPENVLFDLPALDNVAKDHETDREGMANTSERTDGVHHNTALIAGQILAGNLFNTAYLSYDRAGKEKVCASVNGYLCRSDYYVQVPQEEILDAASGSCKEPWPVVPNFQNWRFPHNRLPGPWASLTAAGITEASLSRLNCMITVASQSGCDNIHIIPKGLITMAWFKENNMRAYSSLPESRAIHDVANRAVMRCDLHRFFNDRTFAIVPKPVAPRVANHSLAVHFVCAGSNMNYAVREFHNQIVLENAICPQYLFARFAYTIFGLTKSFVLDGEKRRLMLATCVDGAWATTVADFDKQKRDSMFGGGGTHSSHKRRCTAGPAEQDEDGFSAYGYSSDDDEGDEQPRRDPPWIYPV